MDFTDFANPTNIVMRGHVGTVEYGGGDRGMVVMFYNKPEHDPQASLATGSPQYKDVVFVKIHPPGERLNIVDRPAKGEDSRRWPNQWAAFSQNRQQIPEGTPVDLLYPDRPSIAAQLRANGVYVIEDLAELSANAMDTVGMGAQTWVNDAKKYLAAAQKGMGAAKIRAELEDRDRQIKVLVEQVQNLTKQVTMLQAARVQQADIMGQALVSGAMTRPQHMPAIQFDAQTAQINANNSASRAPAPQKRQRAKLRA
jgi:hypothetical protein